MTALEELELWFQREKRDNGLVDVKFSEWDGVPYRSDMAEAEVATNVESMAADVLRVLKSPPSARTDVTHVRL